MLRYLLWKGRDGVLNTDGLGDEASKIDLRENVGRDLAFQVIAGACAARGMSGAEKDAVLTTVARRLNVAYDELITRRFLHLMSPDEVARLPHELIDVQLHTHRHRVPTERAGFDREIADNRREISGMTSKSERAIAHFCYPSGVTHPSFAGWLRALGVRTATTTIPGIASADSDPLLLPRLIDTVNVSELEFEGWLTGASAFLPRRRIRATAPI